MTDSSDPPQHVTLAPLQYWLVTLAVMATTLIQFLDMTIANVAIPHMQASLGASSESISWVLTSFIVASAIAIPLSGWIAAQFGTRGPFLLTVSGFIAASMLCGSAQNLTQMVIFRALQGMAAAFIAPIGQTILLNINPADRFTRALSLWGATSMLGPITGPTLGGWLTDNFNWRWVFFINIPVGVPALLILWRILPDTPITRRRFDVMSFTCLAIGLAALQVLLDRGQHNDWFDSSESLIELLLACAALWAFVVHSWFSREPVFPRSLMTNRKVYTSIAFGAVQGWAMLGIAAILPSMLQGLFGYSVMQTGEVMAPRGLGIMITMSFLPMVMDRIRTRHIMAVGFSVVALTNYEMTTWTLDIEPWRFGVNSFIQGLGLGFLMMPINYYAFSSVRPEERTDCSSVLSLFRNVSGSIGISVFVTILSRSNQIIHAELVSRVPMFGGALQDIPGLADGDVAGLSMLNAQVMRQAAMISYLNVFQLLFVITAITVPICLLVKGRAR